MADVKVKKEAGSVQHMPVVMERVMVVKQEKDADDPCPRLVVKEFLRPKKHQGDSVQGPALRALHSNILGVDHVSIAVAKSSPYYKPVMKLDCPPNLL